MKPVVNIGPRRIEEEPVSACSFVKTSFPVNLSSDTSFICCNTLQASPRCMLCYSKTYDCINQNPTRKFLS